jgi:hypothetical protein
MLLNPSVNDFKKKKIMRQVDQYRHLGNEYITGDLPGNKAIARNDSVLGYQSFSQTITRRRPPLWSSGQSFWLQIQRFRVRFPDLTGFSEK